MNLAHLTVLRSLLAIAGLLVAVRVTAAENPVSNVPLVVALSDAHELAAGRASLKVLRVEGTSMLPYFGPGSVLVIKQLPASRLRAGMLVVYTNRFNETVAHRLTSLNDATGWTVQGYNNGRADSTPVSGSNLIGVVYATFHSDAAPLDATLLATVNTTTSVALAAPAR